MADTSYDYLISQLVQAKATLETIKGVAHELTRDGMLTGECRNIESTIGDVAYMELLVRQRASGALATRIAS